LIKPLEKVKLKEVLGKYLSVLSSDN